MSAEVQGAPSTTNKPRRVYGRVLAVAAVGIVVCAVAVTTWGGFGPPPDAAAAGIVVGEVEVGGRTEEDVRQLLQDLGEQMQSKPIALTIGTEELIVTPREIGFALDVEATTKAVFAVAREKGWRAAIRSINRTRTEVTVSFSIDETAFNELIPIWEHVLIKETPFDGALQIVDGAVVAEAPRKGYVLDRAKLLAKIQQLLARGAGGAVLVDLVEVVPPIDPAEVEKAAKTARAILSGPITLGYTPSEAEIEVARKENEEAQKRRTDAEKRDKQKLPKKKSRMKRKGRRFVEEREITKKAETFPLPEPVEVVFRKEDLLAAFRARRIDEPTPHFAVELDEAEVKRKLAPTVAKLYNAARDARFDIDNEGRVTIVPSRPGTRVDSTRLVDALYAAASKPERTGDLPVDKNAEPKFTTQAAERLGIKGLVSEFITHHACCQPRVKNIHRICDMLDGAIVKPDETFSVNAAIGPRTLARGFVVAPSIGDGEMTETPGGGVSQVATTLYNAVFDGGYVIRERKPHSFYFNRYPMGLEATLSYPSPDLVFYNDTKAAMLLRCDYSETFVRVRLFGDNGGRHVNRRVSQPFEYTEPRVEYEANSRRNPDSEKVRQSGSHGFSVVTTRILTMADGSRKEEKRTVKYTGKPRLVEVHPCKIPKGEKGYTGEKCPEPKEEEGGGGEQ